MKQIIKNISKKIVPNKLKYLINGFRKLSNNRDYRREIAYLKNDLLYFKILHYFEYNRPEEYQDEIKYLKKIGTLTPFPYDRTDKEPGNITVDFDKNKKMPFILHKDKKLYFPKFYNTEQAKNLYLNLLVNENILGGRFRKMNPHQYTTESFFVKDGDIVLDIGACEGLFLLDVVDKIKKGFIFESDKNWIEALTATFEPFKEKVMIINKLASNKDSSNEMTVDSCLKNEYGNIFIKMDVEGSESMVLQGSKSVLNRKNDIRVACCTYHKNDDANLLEKFFNDMHYHTEFSDGYMLFFHDMDIKPPYFRKGLIRAWNL